MIHSVIEASLELEYRIECWVAGMIDISPSTATTSSRLDSLRAYRKARTEHAWKKRSPDVEFNRHGTRIYVFGPVCCLQTRNAVRFLQIECPFRGLPRREWTIDLSLEFEPGSLTYDHSQRLLILTQDVYVLLTTLTTVY